MIIFRNITIFVARVERRQDEKRNNLNYLKVFGSVVKLTDKDKIQRTIAQNEEKFRPFENLFYTHSYDFRAIRYYSTEEKMQKIERMMNNTEMRYKEFETNIEHPYMILEVKAAFFTCHSFEENIFPMLYILDYIGGNLAIPWNLKRRDKEEKDTKIEEIEKEISGFSNHKIEYYEEKSPIDYEKIERKLL